MEGWIGMGFATPVPDCLITILGMLRMSLNQMKFIQPIRHCLDRNFELFVHWNDVVAEKVSGTTSKCESPLPRIRVCPE